MAVGTYALTTLAKLKAFLSIGHTTSDTLLEDCIDRTTAIFEEYTRRNLKARDYHYDSDDGDYDADNAILDGTGTDTVNLPQYPAVSLTTLRVNTTAITERDTILSVGWVLDKQNGIVTLVGYIFTKGVKNIELAYNAGFATIPEDLEQAAIEQAAWMFKQSAPGGNMLGVQAKNLADGSITYTARHLLPGVKDTLEVYKKRFAY